MKLDYDMVSPCIKGHRSVVGKMIEEFVNSGKDIAEICDINDCYNSIHTAYVAYLDETKKRGLKNQIAISRFRGRLFLIKLTGGKQ